ncbi:MAG: HD domain-containing protein [Promethearchaeota archaeon]
MTDISKYWEALTFISVRHGDQKRISSNIPYIIHPIRVAAILRSFGFSEQDNEDLLIAALLHDLIEDTSTTLGEIKQYFNEKIMLIVSELSKPKKKDKEIWLNSFETKSDEAKIIKMADRIDNLMDIIQINWKIEKKRIYLEHANIILEKCGNAHVNLAKKLEQMIEKLSNELKS